MLKAMHATLRMVVLFSMRVLSQLDALLFGRM